MKRWLSLALALALLCALPLTAAVAEQNVDLTGKLVIVHTNDVHGYAETSLTEPSTGYAQVKQYKEDAERLGASVLLLDAGDVSQGRPLVNLSMGRDRL